MRGNAGQSAVEAAMVIGAVVLAASMMAIYVRGSLRANVKLTEMQLNGAIQDNRP